MLLSMLISTETDVFQPDIVILTNENRHILTDAGAEGPPDFVVEILSPETRLIWKTRREPMPGWWLDERTLGGPKRKTCACYNLLTDPAELTCARVTRRLWTNPSVINCFRCKLELSRIRGKTDAISLIVKAGVNDSHPEGDNIANLELGC